MLITSALSDTIEYRGGWILMKRESAQEVDVPKRELLRKWDPTDTHLDAYAMIHTGVC